jgi:hypothetical protein
MAPLALTYGAVASAAELLRLAGIMPGAHNAQIGDAGTTSALAHREQADRRLSLELQRHANRQMRGVRGKGLPPEEVAGYGRRVGIYLAMVRRARLRAVAPGVGLAPAH